MSGRPRDLCAAVAAGALLGLALAEARSRWRKRKHQLLPDAFPVDGTLLGQLANLTRSAEERYVPRPPYRVSQTPRRELTAEEQARFQRDGFLVIRGWFTPEEVGVVQAAVEADVAVREHTKKKKDAAGGDTKLSLWWYVGEDAYGNVARSASVVAAAAALMGGAEPYHSHTKLLLKEPRTGGAWEWHQDFGYWYAQGLRNPEGIVNVLMPLDHNAEENGAMKLLRGSHKLGRLDHGRFGDQAGADPARVVAAFDAFEAVTLALEPTDIAFMHSNTLHSSAPNASDHWRRNMIVAFNSRGNEPLPGSPEGQPPYTALDVLPDAALAERGPVPASRSNQFLV